MRTALDPVTIALSNGRELTADLTVYITDDPFEDGDVDFGPEENEAYAEKMRNGELQSVLIEVRASFEGMIHGSDYLGKCHIRSAEFAQDVLDTIKDHGMVDRAVVELRDELEQLDSKLSDKS